MIVADDVVAAVLLLLLLIPKLRMQLLLLLPLRDNTSLLALILMDPNSRTKERNSFFFSTGHGPILKGDRWDQAGPHDVAILGVDASN